MDEMAAQTETRFVLITHNPITMARMNRLFGVTMAEQGVSQLVSVDLDAAEELREANKKLEETFAQEIHNVLKEGANTLVYACGRSV